jgi:hypothetical protein
MAVAPLGYGSFGGAVAGTDTSGHGSGGSSAGTLKTAAFFAHIVDTLGELTESREKIEFTNSASPNNAAQFVPGDIITGGEYELTLLHDTQAAVPWGDAETIEITLPKRGTAATAAKKSFQGFLTKHVCSFPFKDKMITKCTLAITGVVTHTPAA